VKREAKRYTIGDRTLTIKQWAAEAGIPPQYIYNRIQLGWSIEEAIGTPVLAHGGKRKRVSRSEEVHRVIPESESSYTPTPKSEKQLREERADARIEEEIRKLRDLVSMNRRGQP